LEITASLIKDLREKTGVGIMDCKKALKECDGDIEKSIEYLRKKGIATAKKRGGRATSQGQVQSYIHAGGKIGVLVEVNCETDFTAKTDDFENFAQIPLSDHVAGEFDHRISGVVVHQAEDLASLLDDLFEFFGLGDVDRHRLFAHYVEAGFEEVFGDREVPVVGCGDRNEVDPFTHGQLQFFFDHFLVGAIDALGIEQKLPALLLGSAGVDIECPGYQINTAVQTRRLAMHVTDECSGPAADHSHFQISIESHTCSFQQNSGITSCVLRYVFNRPKTTFATKAKTPASGIIELNTDNATQKAAVLGHRNMARQS